MVKLNEYTELSQNLLGRLVGMGQGDDAGCRAPASRNAGWSIRSRSRRWGGAPAQPTTGGQRLVNKLLVNGPAVSREALNARAEQRQLLDCFSRSFDAVIRKII